MKTIRIGIAGATGYTGSELVRILSRHPFARIEILTSENHHAEKFSTVYPAFRGIEDRALQPLSALAACDLDLIFLALPNGVSMEFVRAHGADRYRVIDMSGDFRLHSADVYEHWYRAKHVCAEYLGATTYGLPELFRELIRTAKFVANPGCYPTSAILALAPLVKHHLISPTGIIIDSKSGVTGAGANAKASTHFPEVFDNFRAYGLLSHRHTPEIEQVLADVAQQEIQTLFTPHLLPIDRGILTTVYATAAKSVTTEQLREIVREFYSGEPFIRVVDSPPAVKHVRGSNYCDLYVTHDERTNHVIAIAALDNLVKGASGQAVQNMNIMFGLPETSGLEQNPLSP